ncbi:MAG TPA: NADH-quinone oxidoreductase subunit NuoF [Vicinamibacterales bacterium]|nr:NADH-quinone oxidoreductase subunit NuoF [Vicinamibacterales bacterium]
MSFHPAMPYGTERWHRSERQTLPEGPEFSFTPERRAEFERLAAHYPPEHRRSSVLYALYLAQDQQGYISANAARHVAEVVGITTADVEDVVSYYVMFHRAPVGKYVLQVYTTLSCALAGAERVLESMEQVLGIKAGETDPSGLFTIQQMECLGACDRAPVMMVNNNEWHEHLQPEQVAGLVDRMKTDGIKALSNCHLCEQRVSEGKKTTTPAKAKAVPDYEPVLTKYAFTPGGAELDHYVKNQAGYQGLKKALSMAPDAVIEEVKKSGLRGRGGAGFPTGLKWQFVDKKSPKPKYIVCNADESEPGTFKDHLLMERNPHLLVEGCLIGCYAIGSKAAYIYIRGEFYHLFPTMQQAIDDARKAGYLGKNIMGSGFDCEVYLHRGAGAYEAGEETALLESLEGKRAQPRFKPPFPAVEGAWKSPTAVNNVETLCNVPLVMTRGADWFAALGPEKNGGPKLFCVSGAVKNPGVFEAPMKVTLKELIYDYAGGPLDGHHVKAVIPGGSSVPILMPDQLDIPASFDDVQKAGSLLGSAAIMVLDETTDMVWLAENLLHFYRHESCGKCTPCREGTDWLYRLLHRMIEGKATERDIPLLQSVANQINGKTLCAFGDAAATPVLTTLKWFKPEFEAYVKGTPPKPASYRGKPHAPQAFEAANVDKPVGSH